LTADELATLAGCASYCKIDPDDAARMATLDVIRQGVAEQVAEYCRKATGFKAGTKLEFLKLVQRELTIFDQGAHGIAAESAGGVSTTYIQGWPADTLAVLDRDRRVVVL
jgi:hypothetical protein